MSRLLTLRRNLARLLTDAEVDDNFVNVATDFTGSADPAGLAGANILPYMRWADTGTGWLKRRNAANTGWVSESRLLRQALQLFIPSEIPATNMGDIHVDGRGMYRWDGQNYVGQTLASGQLQLMQGTTLFGSFTGDYTEGVSTVLQSAAGSTYVTAVPSGNGVNAGFLARGWKSPNSQFVMIGINRDTGLGQILFSRHGTAGMPNHMSFDSATGECGRVMEDGRWMFGRFLQPNVQSKLHVAFNGGGLEYGIVTRPINPSDSTAIQFQSSTGGVAGYIYSTQALTTTYATTSDYRSKTDLGNLNPTDSLVTVNALRPIFFRMNEAPEGSEVQRGFIAHELQALVPTAVVGKKDEMMKGPDGKDVPRYQGVDMGRIVPDLVAAVQRLTQILEQANTRIAQLEASGLPATPK